MKIAFITEMEFEGYIEQSHPNMRTEFAWMYALHANHIPLSKCNEVFGYDHVLVIIPKGFSINIRSDGLKISDNPISSTDLLSQPIIEILKSNNKKVHYVQEGPSWWFNDYEIIDQFNFYNLLSGVDSIFAHNEHDCKFYRGLFPNKPIRVIPTLLIEDQIQYIVPKKEEKVLIGGNFARWYGGFQSYLVADEFNVEKWTQESHAKRENESDIHDLNHLPRLRWVDWMNVLSTFKYAVHLMPTIAAGTFSLNCAYFGIPCIGNEKVDTQRICHPELSVDVDDVEKARSLAKKLKTDIKFYQQCSKQSKVNYKKFYNINQFKNRIQL